MSLAQGAGAIGSAAPEGVGRHATVRGVRVIRRVGHGLVVVSLSACHSTAPSPADSAVATPVAPTTPLVDAGPTVMSTPSMPGVPGTADAGVSPDASTYMNTWWVSDACPSRSYKRTLSLHADSTFDAEDIVHPCAGECVVQWVDKRSGTWSATGRKVMLVVTKEDGPARERKDAVALPSTLTIDLPHLTLIEANPACVYVGARGQP